LFPLSVNEEGLFNVGGKDYKIDNGTIFDADQNEIVVVKKEAVTYEDESGNFIFKASKEFGIY